MRNFPSRATASSSSPWLPKSRTKLLVLAVAACFASNSQALPTDPVVASGNASFAQSGNVLTVTNSNGAIINWNKFSIGVNETTRFIQTSASSAVLNRVLANDPSLIYGTLSSNGKVWLINPAGIMVGASGRVDTAGFVASTLNISNQNFLAGRNLFEATPGAGSVVNQGSITTPSGGSVYLIGPNVTNEGMITTPQGETILAAGQTVSLIDTATPGVKVDITGAEGNVTNLGSVIAEAGRIGMAGILVKNSGMLNASSVVNEGGRVFLKAAKDTVVDGNGRIVVTGSKGGSVEVLGNRVAVLDNASIDASATSEGGDGGSIKVGGDYQGRNPDIQNASVTYFGSNARLKADAGRVGDGGTVIVWADDTTRAYGNISVRGGALGGNGGFVEVSGKQSLVFRGFADRRAPHGRAGTLLLDPAEYTIDGTEWVTIDANLYGGDVVITTSGAYGGDIQWLTGTYASVNTYALSLLAYGGGAATGNITTGVGGATTINLSGGLVMKAGWDGVSTVTPNVVATKGNIDLTATTITTNGGSILLHAGNNVLGGGILDTTPSWPGATAGNITVTGKSISLGNLTARGAGGPSSDTNAGDGGVVTLTATAGSVSAGTIDTRGGQGYDGGEGSYGGAGGNGGDVSIAAYGGTVTITAINAQGGRGGNGGAGYYSFSGGNGATGGPGGIVSVYGDSISITGGIASFGGKGGNGGSMGTGSGAGSPGSGGVGGAVTLTAVAGDILVGDINAYGGDAGWNEFPGSSDRRGGDGGSVSITASGGISVGTINTHGGNAAGSSSGGRGGDVSLTASGIHAGTGKAISVTSIDTHGGDDSYDGNQDGGDVTLVSNSTGVSLTGTAIAITSINTRGGNDLGDSSGGDGGAVSITTASGGVTIASIDTRGGNSAGNSSGGNGGNVTISTANGSIAVGLIDARGGDGNSSGGNGGNIVLTTTLGGDVSIGAVNVAGGVGGEGDGSAGNITVDAYGNIGFSQVGDVTSTTNLNVSSTVGDMAIGATGNMTIAGGIFTGAVGSSTILSAGGTLTLASNLGITGSLGLSGSSVVASSLITASATQDIVVIAGALDLSGGAKLDAGVDLGVLAATVNLTSGSMLKAGNEMEIAANSLSLNLSQIEATASAVTIAVIKNITLDNGSYIKAGTDVKLTLNGADSLLTLNSVSGQTPSYIWAQSPSTIFLSFPLLASGGVMIDGATTLETLAGGSGLFAGPGMTPARDGFGLSLAYQPALIDTTVTTDLLRAISTIDPETTPTTQDDGLKNDDPKRLSGYTTGGTGDEFGGEESKDEKDKDKDKNAGTGSDKPRPNKGKQRVASCS